MNLFRLLFLSSLPALSFAQTLAGITEADFGFRSNRDFLAQKQGPKKPTVTKDVVVFIGDRVIPQFVDGGSWQTSVTVINLENHSTNFQVLFFNDDGTDLYVPVVGTRPSQRRDNHPQYRGKHDISDHRNQCGSRSGLGIALAEHKRLSRSNGDLPPERPRTTDAGSRRAGCQPVR